MQLVHFLQTHPATYYLCVIILGLLVGSFLNVVIHRLPRMMLREWRRECRSLLELDGGREEQNTAPFNLVVPGSACPACNHRISALENIPVISYLALRGRCSACGSPIPLRYPVVESVSAVAVFLVAWHFGWSVQTFPAMLLTWALIALAVIDLDHKLLPDDITLPFLWLGLLVNLGGVYTDIHSSVIGAAGGYLTLWSVYMLFKLITGKEGMGYGDFKLLAMLGAWLGWQSLPLIIILSSLVGTIVGLALIIFRKHGRSEPIPFGPYLAAAGWIALLYGDPVMQAYYDWAFTTL
jgi:leader peptidase (prepilin peptidase)/N-methyltransferase